MSHDSDYPPIAEYALIGDCHGAALVSRAGSIDWCCVPRFDSGSCFARMLDARRGGFCAIELADEDQAAEREYLEGTLVLATTLGGKVHVQDAFAVPCARADGRPAPEILRVIEGVHGEARARLTVAPRFDYGEVDPWIRDHGGGVFSAIGGNDGLVVWSDAPLAPENRTLTATLTVREGDRIRLWIASRPPELIGAAPPAPPDVDERLAATVRWWRDWAARGCADGATLRSALVLKGLTYE